MKKRTENIIVKAAITIGLSSGSVVASAIGYYILGCIVGLLILPREHEHEYACACDAPPLMTESEASIVGAIFLIGLMTFMFFLLRSLKFSKWEQAVALSVLLLVNLYVVWGMRALFFTQVSG